MNTEDTGAVVLAALRRWARESGLSQTELAERTGMSQATLSRYLSGRVQRLQRDTINRLLDHIPRRLLMAESKRAAAPHEVRSRSGGPPTVFVSSTYLDNIERRGWIREAVERAGMVPLAMERWTANQLPARHLCVHRVGEADVFVGILAWRYGWIPEGEEKSITELEYDEAERLDIPRLMFIVDQPLERVNVTTEFDTDDPWLKQALLDRFKARINRDVTAHPFQDKELKTHVLQALFEWKERRAQPGSPHATEPDPFDPLEDHEQTLADYLEAVEAEHSHVVLPGFETRLRVPLQLDDLFVPIDIEAGEGAGEFDEDHPAAKHERPGKAEDGETRPSLTLPLALAGLSEDPRRSAIVMLGHPGSGKTTQLRRLALSAVRDPASLGLPDDLIPVFVPLRKLQPEDGSLKQLVCRLLADEDLGLGAAFARWLWDHERLLLLIDGLDEVGSSSRSSQAGAAVTSDRRAQVRDWIETVARNPRRDSLIVVTCRNEGYTRMTRFGPEFLPLSLRPLNREQADQFVQHWYEAVAVGLLPPDARQRERRTTSRTAQLSAQALIERLHDSTIRATRVLELARNPLLLSAICLIHRDRAKLPERAAELYKDTVDVLLQHWREAKRLPVSFEAKDAREVLQPVALWLHQEEGRTQGSEDEICDVLEPAFQERGWRDLSARNFLSTIRDESGLLTGWSSESYGFMHLGFQEYLAALELHQRIQRKAGDEAGFAGEVDAVARHFGSTWWREVISLVFAVDEAGGLYTPLMRALLRHPDLSQHEDLARQCIHDARRFDPTPFHELLQLPADDGLWANRHVAANLLLSCGDEEVLPGDTAPARELIRRKPGRRHSFWADQHLALRIVDRLAPVEAVSLAEDLTDHPHVELRELARTLLLRRTGDARAHAGESGVSATGTILREQDATTAPRGGCELVLVPGGRFQMGSPEREEGHYEDESPLHKVTVEPFYLALHPVTNEEYARFLAEADADAKEPDYWTDRNFNRPRQPVVGVSWKDAQAYCKWAGLRLPTEAEWEYACRAGTVTRFWSGNADRDLDRVGWYAGNSDSKLHAVGEKPANPFGLFDMHGNVWEWCEDMWSGDYSESQAAHPGAYKKGSVGYRVNRGGSFGSSARVARSAYRISVLPSYRRRGRGFRPAMGITPS